MGNDGWCSGCKFRLSCIKQTSKQTIDQSYLQQVSALKLQLNTGIL